MTSRSSSRSSSVPPPQASPPQTPRPLRALFVVELRLFLREPFAVFFTLLFPLLLLLIFGVTFGQQDADFGLKVRDYLVPATIGTVTAYLGLMGIPIALSEYREMGVLQRFRVSPLRLRTFLTAHFLVEGLFLLASCLLLVVVGIGGFRTIAPSNPLYLAAVLVVSAVALFAAGFTVAAMAKSSRAAQAIGAGVFFPMLFLSGAAIPTQQMPEWLQNVSSYLPLTKIVDALTSAWIGHSYGTNSWLSVPYLLIVVVACMAAIRRSYRW